MLTEDPSTGDLSLVGGSLVTIDDRATETGQRILGRIKTVRGEWFLDQSFGLDYREAIWNKQTSTQARDAHIQEQALLSSGRGSKITQYNTVLDSANRTLEVEIDVQDLDGITTSVSLEV